eukprot:COSAG04_NODE_3358_length_2895_cov_2.093348_1_plen_400_part_00
MRRDGDFTTLDPLLHRQWRERLELAVREGDMLKVLNGWMLFGGPASGGEDWATWMRLPEWDWSFFTDDVMLRTLEAYDWDEDPHTTFWNPVALGIGPAVSALRGNLDASRRGAEICLEVCQRMVDGLGGSHATTFRIVVEGAASRWPWQLRMMGRTQDAAKLMTDLGFTWSTADACADEKASIDFSVRKRGSTERGTGFENQSAEDYAWSVKLNYVLCTSWREVPPADIIAALPSPELLESYMIDINQFPGISLLRRLDTKNLLLLAAEVCEKLERPADALLYLDKVLRVDESDPTTDMRPITHAEGHALRGRMFAAQGKEEAAEASFEEAIEVSHRTGLRLLEMFALRDLKKHVLDGDGRGEEGIRRLKAVLREMKGPPTELTKLLGEGLDAEAMLRS